MISAAALAAAAAVVEKIVAIAKAALGLVPTPAGNAARAAGIGALAIVAVLVAGLAAWSLWPETGKPDKADVCREACDKAHLEAEVKALRAAAALGAEQRRMQAEAVAQLEAQIETMQQQQEAARAHSPDSDALVVRADDPWLLKGAAASGAARGAGRGGNRADPLPRR